MRLSLAFAMAALSCAALSPAAASDAFEQALAQAQLDARLPESGDWFAQRMRPALDERFRAAISQCASPQDLEDGVVADLVLVLDREGQVQRSFWRKESALNQCMDAQLRATRYPGAAKADFHLGLSFNWLTRPPPSPSPETAKRQAERVGAPVLDAALQCDAHALPRRWPDGSPYPNLEQGWVVVEFDLEGDGKPKRLRIAKSSGAPVLERFALDSEAISTYQTGVYKRCQSLTTSFKH